MASSQNTSRKRSAASSSSRQPPDRVFFVDRSLGRKKVPEALRQAGTDVRVFDDLFPQDTPDVEWLANVGRQGWVVLTRDQRIRYNRVEREALFAANIQCFTLTSSGVTGEEAGAILVSAMSRMKLLCGRRRGRPFIAKVSRGPTVAIVTDKA